MAPPERVANKRVQQSLSFCHYNKNRGTGCMFFSSKGSSWYWWSPYALCARLPHHISIYPIHPVPQRSPMCARASIDWMGIIDASMSIIDAPATPWCTARHDALSKIGPFSQIGAFQRYNRDKCTVSILPQICDVTEALSKCVIEN